MKDEQEYRAWHRCLLLSDRSKWSPKVEEAFGEAHGLPWEPWWAQCKEQFIPLDRWLIEEITSPEEFVKWSIGDDSEVVVLLNLLSPKTEVLAAVSQLLDERHKGRPGRPIREDFSDWPVRGHPNVVALNKALDVYEKANEVGDSKTWWEIGKTCKVNLAYASADPDSESGEPSRDDKRVLAITALRYYRRAERLIAGVENGIFPAP